MELIKKTDDMVAFKTNISTSLANAIRRSVNEVSTLAIDEVDIYKNDCALYDEVIAHRLGLLPLKNQKMKADAIMELKLKAKGAEGSSDVLAGEMGDLVVYPDMLIALLEKDQELELVARAKQGIGLEHAKHTPGLVYYKIVNDIKISKEGEGNAELAELYPNTFEFDGKLKVKDTAWNDDIDQDDVKDFKGIEIKPTNEIIFVIETWNQISCKEIFSESVKALTKNLDELAKAVK